MKKIQNAALPPTGSDSRVFLATLGSTHGSWENLKQTVTRPGSCEDLRARDGGTRWCCHVTSQPVLPSCGLFSCS